MKSCCFTGHRTIPASSYSLVKSRTNAVIFHLIKQGVTDFYCGGALGYDTLSALAVLRIKKIYPHIRLILALPCMDQDKFWNNENRKIYAYIKANADKVIFVSRDYSKGCMLKRNRFLVDRCDYCICYLKKETGGTAYTVNYAKGQNKKIYYVN